jgi:cell division inhibitor SepF
MGLWSELKKLTKPYDDDDYEDFTPTSAERLPATPKTPTQARSSYGGFEERRDANKVVNIHATTQLAVVLVKPSDSRTPRISPTTCGTSAPSF